MQRQIPSNLRIRTDSEANWAKNNPVLLNGEMAYSNDMYKFKVGNGILPWSAIEYANNIIDISQLNNNVGYALIEVGTNEQWEQKKGFVSEKGKIYIISDYYTDEDGKKYPGIRIGDGNAYIIDLPVISEFSPTILEHINNKTIHITQDEREDWNGKIRCSVEGDNLIFSTL